MLIVRLRRLNEYKANYIRLQNQPPSLKNAFPPTIEPLRHPSISYIIIRSYNPNV